MFARHCAGPPSSTSEWGGRGAHRAEGQGLSIIPHPPPEPLPAGHRDLVAAPSAGSPHGPTTSWMVTARPALLPTPACTGPQGLGGLRQAPVFPRSFIHSSGEKGELLSQSHMWHLANSGWKKGRMVGRASGCGRTLPWEKRLHLRTRVGGGEPQAEPRSSDNTCSSAGGAKGAAPRAAIFLGHRNGHTPEGHALGEGQILFPGQEGHLGRLPSQWEGHGSDSSAPRRNLSLVKELGDRAAQGRAYGNLGNTHYLLGSFVEATTFHKEVSGQWGRRRQGSGYPTGLPTSSGFGAGAPRAAPSGHRHGASHPAVHVGSWGCSVTPRVLGLCPQRLAIAKEFGDKAAERRAYSNLGNAHIFLGRFDVAAEYYK